MRKLKSNRVYDLSTINTIKTRKQINVNENILNLVFSSNYSYLPPPIISCICTNETSISFVKSMTARFGSS